MNTITNNDIYPQRPPTRAASANEAAGMLFPEIAKHFDAFWEKSNSDPVQVPYTELLDLNDEFWALSLGSLGSPQTPIVYASAENHFYRYNQSKGLYEPISESAVVGELLSNLDLCASFFPHRLHVSSFLALKNRQKLKSVVDRAKDLLKVEEDFFKDHQYLHLACSNGVLQIDNNTFKQSSPSVPVRDPLPVKYDPEAKCDLFLNSFLAHILSSEDIDLLQRYLSQVLEGINHSQTILVLTGDAGWGKSSLMKILGALIGWNRIGIIREQLFKDEFELAHYAGKHFLFHPDMPTDFLHRKEASIFKQLVGSDPLWANVKGDEGRIVLHGDFPVVLSCNGKPKIHLDEDADAWLRRLVVLSFKTPSHETHFGKMADLILKNESSGILNWLLEGRNKLFKDKFQLKMTSEQKARSENLLLASQSPSAFVQSCLEKREGSEIAAVDLYSHYQEWCRENQIRACASQAFTQAAKEEIELHLGLRYRHDLGDKDGVSRGWKGVGLVERANVENAKNASAGSEA